MNTTQIPKTIHYCWLSGSELPESAVECLESWKRHMPEYKLVLWDMNKFDIASHTFVKEACQVRKWAFAADYIRLYALYTEGGIYLDTDVYVQKSFNDFLKHGFFSAVEYDERFVKNGAHLLNADGTLKDKTAGEIYTHGIQIQAAIMGGVKGHPFLKACLDWYGSKHFILEDGSYYDKIIAPYIYAHVATKYGFRYKNELQELGDDITVYPTSVFAGSPAQAKKDCYAVHRCEGAWRSSRYQLIRKLRENNYLRMLFGKKKLEKLD